MAFNVRVKAVSIDKEMRRAMRNMPRATHEFAEWTIPQADPYVPYKSGALAHSARVDDHVTTYQRRPGKHEHSRTPAQRYSSHVVYDMPYAHHMYMGLKIWMPGMAYRSVFKKLPKEEFLNYSTAVHPKAQRMWYLGAQNDHLQEYEAKMKELVTAELKRGGLAIKLK